MKYEDFMQALAADDELKKKYQEKLEAVKPADEQSAWQIAGEVARELGFDVDAGEFALAQRSAHVLSDDELDAVTGGGREKCIMDYICLFGWNTCYSTNECSDFEVCGNNISCAAGNWIRPCGSNGSCSDNYTGHTA